MLIDNKFVEMLKEKTKGKDCKGKWIHIKIKKKEDENGKKIK